MDENATTPPPPPAPAGGRQTSSMAVVALVSGLLGWTLLPFIGSVVAIITGHMARAEIRRSPDTLDGDGLAVIGLVLGWGSVILSVLAVLVAVLFFGGIAVLLAAIGLSGHMH